VRINSILCLHMNISRNIHIIQNKPTINNESKASAIIDGYQISSRLSDWLVAERPTRCVPVTKMKAVRPTCTSQSPIIAVSKQRFCLVTATKVDFIVD